MMSKQEILKAIRVCAKKLGRSPSLRELRRLAGVNGTRLDKEFGSLSKALAAAGLEAVGSGFEVAESALLLDRAALLLDGWLCHPGRPDNDERRHQGERQPQFGASHAWTPLP